MIKVYVDWSVMSQMKHGFHKELFKLLTRKKQIVVIYSTSHITDIRVSYKEGDAVQSKRIEKDLQYLSNLTGDNCAFNENKNIVIGYKDPKQLLEEQVNQQQNYGDDGPLASALSCLEPGTEAYKLLKARIDSPIPQIIAQVFSDPISAAGMRERYPGLEENPTYGNLIKIGWLQNKKLTQTDAYGNLRKTIQDGLGINRDRMFAKPEPFKAINKLYEKLGDNTGRRVIKFDFTSDSPLWFQEIYNNYIKLDMHGYQEDKIRVDEKNKDTFRNTIDDGFHTAFASMCDFYITSDHRAINKAKQVYQELKINTRIFSPAEFITYGNDSIVHDDPKLHLDIWFKLLESQPYLETILDDAVWRTYFLEFFIFDYFNKIYVVTNDKERFPTILLSKEKPSNYRFTNQSEVSTLIDKLNIAFDINENPPTNPNDIRFDNWKDYRWNWKNFEFKLTFSQGYLQLYLEPCVY